MSLHYAGRTRESCTRGQTGLVRLYGPWLSGRPQPAPRAHRHSGPLALLRSAGPRRAVVRTALAAVPGPLMWKGGRAHSQAPGH